MIVKKIIDNENGKRWDIIKHEENRYSVNYYEYFQATGWRQYKMPKEYLTKECVEFEFDCTVA